MASWGRAATASSSDRERVGEQDQACRSWRLGEVLEVALLPLAPRRLGVGVGVGAGFDESSDAITEACADRVAGAPVVGVVLDGVVEQGRDRLVFVATLLEYDGGDGHQV